MSAWDTYESRMNAIGSNRRDAVLKREQRFLTTKLPSNLSYQTVTIDSVSQDVAIINTDNLDEKFIFSMPNENITHGGLVKWENNLWLVTERDAADEVYTRAKMIQCNYLLRWVDPISNEVIERWCIIEDGTKYLVGEYGDRDLVMNRGDTRITMTITKDEYTVRFGRNSRFIIDDYCAPEPLAYRMTKPYKLGNNYNNSGVFCFVLTECNTEPDDNLDLHIADYYTYFPKTPESPAAPDIADTPIEERRVWI